MHIRTLLFSLVATIALAADVPVGIFEGQSAVGNPARAGSVAYDAGARSYRVSGGGANVWAKEDALHFVWKKVSGDVALSADIRFEGTGGEAHRKAVLMLRQTLDADSAYGDAATHGDGLTSLQVRDVKGETTH